MCGSFFTEGRRAHATPWRVSIAGSWLPCALMVCSRKGVEVVMEVGMGIACPRRFHPLSRVVNGPNVVPFRTPLGWVVTSDAAGRLWEGGVKG